MKGRAFAAVVLSALLLLSGLGIGGWWLLWRRGPLQLAHHSLAMPRAARFVPASASFSLYLFSDGQRPVDYARAVAPARQRRAAGEAIARLRDGAFAAAGLDYPGELAGWLGGESAMALFEDPVAATGSREQPARGWLLALASRDDDGARRFLQRFWQTRSLAGTDLQVSRYRGMGLISGRGSLLGSQPEPLATALVDDDLVLIASGRNLLERALDASQIPELNQAGQPLLRQGVASFASGAALAVASPQALQSWLGLPPLEVSPALNAPLAGAERTAPELAAPPVPSAAPAGQVPVPASQLPAAAPAASAAAGRGASSAARSAAGRPAAEAARDDSSAAAAADPSPAASSPPPEADRSAPEPATPPLSSNARSGVESSRESGAAAAGAAERASAPAAALPDASTGASGGGAAPPGSAAPRVAADPAIPAVPSGSSGSASSPQASASSEAPSDAPSEAPSEAGSAAAPSASRAGADVRAPAVPAAPGGSDRAAAADTAGREPSPADTGAWHRPLEPAEPAAARSAWSAGADRPSTASRLLRAPWAVQPAHALATAAFRQPSQTAAFRQPSQTAAERQLSMGTATLLAVLQPQGRQLELRARLLLPQAPRLEALQPELAETLLAVLRGSPGSLALIQDPAALGQQPLLRPLLERCLGLRPQAAAERQGPLPSLLARGVHGPLLASQSREGWQLATPEGDPAAEDLEPLLRQEGLLEAPLALDGHQLRVWTRLSLPGRSGRRDQSGRDVLEAPLAGWSEQRPPLAWWGQNLATLEAPPESRALSALRRGLRELARPQAPLQLSLDADNARALLRSWQPWRLLSALAGGGLDAPVHGLALAIESPAEVSALELQARLDLGA